MLPRFAALMGRTARRACVVAAVVFGTLSNSQLTFAGPGHSGDEGHSHDNPQAVSAQSPRVVATSESFQLVGILKGGRLTIYLDREPDNVPVTDANITVSSASSSADASSLADGTFEIAAGDWAKPGENEMQFVVVAGGKTDLLGGVLIVPDDGAAGAAAPHAHSHVWDRVLNRASIPYLIVGAFTLTVGIIIGSILAGRKRSGAEAAMLATILAVALSLGFMSSVAIAGPGHSGDEGHSHGPEASAGLSDQASRLPDGSVFLPKPTQRLLEVRTTRTETTETRRVVRIAGRVAAGKTGSVVVVDLYDQADPDKIATAVAIGPGGAQARLGAISKGTELQQNALRLTLDIPADAPSITRAVGQRVTVLLEVDERLAGFLMPRTAVVTAPNGLPVVFEHTEPERFTPKVVKFVPVDNDRVLVTAGLADGEKVVIQAANLINQVR